MWEVARVQWSWMTNYCCRAGWQLIIEGESLWWWNLNWCHSLVLIILDNYHALITRLPLYYYTWLIQWITAHPTEWAIWKCHQSVVCGQFGWINQSQNSVILTHLWSHWKRASCKPDGLPMQNGKVRVFSGSWVFFAVLVASCLVTCAPNDREKSMSLAWTQNEIIHNVFVPHP